MDLASCDLKLARAREKLVSLQADVHDFLAHRALRLKPVRTAEEVRFVAQFYRTPPPEWGLDASEIVYHIRSALDHLVHQLSGTDGSKTQFPIATTPKQFECSSKQRLAGVPNEYRTVISAAQPFRDANPQRHPFVALNELSNRDKHRELTPAVMTLRTWSCTLHIPDVGQQRMDFDLGRERVVLEGDPIFGIRVSALDREGRHVPAGDVLHPPDGLTVPFQVGFVTDVGASAPLGLLNEAGLRAQDLVAACRSVRRASTARA
jgi:hypothetical protein